MKKNYTKTNYSMNSYYCPSVDSLFTTDFISSSIDQFWHDVASKKLNKDNHMIFIPRIKLNNGSYATLSNLQRLNLSDKEKIKTLLVHKLTQNNEGSNAIPLMALSFDYSFREGAHVATDSVIRPSVKMQNYHRPNFPITTNPLDYGKLLLHSNNSFVIRMDKGYLAIIETDSKGNTVKIEKDGDILFEYTDTILSHNSFERRIGQNTFKYVDGIFSLQKSLKKTRTISKKALTKLLTSSFMTLDLETKTNEGNITPVCVGIYDGVASRAYFLLDFIGNVEAMLIKALKSILKRKYDGYVVYIHNLSGFDGNLLLKYMTKVGKVKPIIHEGRIISINLSAANCTLTFYDSYQLLPVSSSKLAQTFGVTEKGLYPYKFLVNTLFTINYRGAVPDIKFFGDITEAQYKEYCKDFQGVEWNLKDETIKYCIRDCVSLYEVLSSFRTLIFDRFKLDTTDYPTLSSLSFSIYRAGFMPNKSIAQLYGQMYAHLKRSYIGGRVDMFKPYGENLFFYDVNSLYPFVMKTFDMPIGTPTIFFGDILKDNPDAFGFFNIKVTAPDNLKHPIIQCHVNTKNGIRSIAGTGTFETMLFSEEIKNALKYGYKFEVQSGYTFERGNLFESFIDNLHQLRITYPKSNPLNLIAKLLMNYLYGRFGMDTSFGETSVVSKSKYPKFEDKYADGITDILDLGESFLVQYRDKAKDEKTIVHGLYETHNSNIAVASAITAYGRILMSSLLNSTEYEVYYTDTNSIVVDKPLPSELVSDSELGKFKLEYQIEKAIFLAPGVYCAVDTAGKLIVKVKGFSDSEKAKLTYEDFEGLLYKDAFLKRTNEVWIRNLSEANISVLHPIYTLKVTDEKRELIYDDSNRLVSTNSIHLNNPTLD